MVDSSVWAGGRIVVWKGEGWRETQHNQASGNIRQTENKKHKQTAPDYERKETKRIKIYQTRRVGKCVCGTETEPNRGK